MSEVEKEVTGTEGATKEVKEKVPGVGDLAKELIRGGKTNEEVLAAVKEKFPEAKTSMASINWYRNKLRGDGETIPTARELKADTNAEVKAKKDAEKAEKKAAANKAKADAKAAKDAEKAEKKAAADKAKADAKAAKDAEKAAAKSGSKPGEGESQTGSEGQNFLE